MMKKMITLLTALITLTIISCNNPHDREATSLPSESGDLIFARGELLNNKNFTGKAWLNSLVVADSVNTNAVTDEEYSADGN